MKRVAISLATLALGLIVTEYALAEKPGGGQGRPGGPPTKGQGPGAQRPGPGGPGGPRMPEQMKRQFDANGDGQLDPQEMTQAREKMQQFQQGLANGQLPPEVMQKFDLNGDGQLDDQEKAALLERMQQARNQRGPNGGGPQFGAAGGFGEGGQFGPPAGEGGPFAPQGEKRRPGSLKKEQILKEYDADGDGKLSPQEKATLREAMQAQRPQPLSREEILQKFDANGDGKLDDAERAKLREAMANRRPVEGKPQPNLGQKLGGEIQPEKQNKPAEK